MKKTVILFTITAVLFACSKSVTNMSGGGSNNSTISCTGTVASFSKDVNPIIQTTCATGSSCHASGSVNGPGELISYSEVQSASEAIRAAVLSGEMPKSGGLSTAQKTELVCWIDNGSTNN